MGVQTVHHTLSLLLLPPQGEDSPCSSSAPVWVLPHRRQSSTNRSNMNPFHGLQFFTNCSSVGPCHGIQSFRNRLLQRGSPTGSQVLPTNLLQGKFLSPWVHRSCQHPAPAWVSHMVTDCFRSIHLLWCGPPRAAGGNLLCCGHPYAAGGQPDSPWSSL